VTINGQRELFLVCKTQGDPGNGQPVTIRMVRLADADGTTVLGDSHQLLHSSVGSFLDTIEVEMLVQHGGWFILFVAHGNWDSCNYSTEWFKSQHAWAWPNNGGTTLLSSAGTGLCGPGDGDVAASQVASQDRIVTDGWVQRNKNTGVISTDGHAARERQRRARDVRGRAEMGVRRLHPDHRRVPEGEYLRQ
jgi:hypothetical protein